MERIHSPISEDIPESQATVRPYNIQELSDLYQVTKKTMRRWITAFGKEIGERNGRYYSVLQVETIFSKLGAPYLVREKE